MHQQEINMKIKELKEKLEKELKNPTKIRFTKEQNVGGANGNVIMNAHISVLKKFHIKMNDLDFLQTRENWFKRDMTNKNLDSSTPSGTFVVQRREYVSSVSPKIMYHLFFPIL